MKHQIDVAAALSILAAMFAWLPPTAALLGIIWYCIQIWESVTVQQFMHRRRERHLIRRRAKLAAQIAKMQGELHAEEGLALLSAARAGLPAPPKADPEPLPVRPVVIVGDVRETTPPPRAPLATPPATKPPQDPDKCEGLVDPGDPLA